MLSFFTIIFFIVVGIFAIIGYFTLGFLETCTGEGLDIFIRDIYIKYIIKKYPEKYYFENNRYWYRTSQYTSNSIYDDPKINKFHNIVSIIIYILWPIDLLYKIIILTILVIQIKTLI